MKSYQIGPVLVLSTTQDEVNGITVPDGYKMFKKYDFYPYKKVVFLFHDIKQPSQIINENNLQYPQIDVPDDIDVVCVCGNSGTGKTSFIKHCLSGPRFSSETVFGSVDINKELNKDRKIKVFSLSFRWDSNRKFVDNLINLLGLKVLLIHIVYEPGFPNIVGYFKDYKPCNIFYPPDPVHLFDCDCKRINVLNEYGKGFSVSEKNYKYASSYFKKKHIPVF